MQSAEIGSRFLRFFEDRGHTPVPSAPLPLPDPTLLVVNAGMVPFKPYFVGEVEPPFSRATSVQKCVRTSDIDEVGKTTRHASFFQMAGNFSFGDYFKAEAIAFAWDLLTSETAAGGYGLDSSRLWVTVYVDDDEAADIWARDIGVPADRIQRRGMVDNFWSMGVPGPCGPSSEIFYDRGPEHGLDGGPVADEDRFVEIWNLVFMQFLRGPGPGKEGYPLLGDLERRGIDTGMGIERMATILQHVDNLYEIDSTRPILDEASRLSGRAYGRDPVDDVRLRVVADHTRAAVMLIGDQVVPGNEGRGYVLRRIMRRTIRSMRLLGAHGSTMKALVSTAIAAMSPQFPELAAEGGRIHTIAEAEESTFLQTLRSGTQIFDLAATRSTSAGSRTLSGDDAFKLHDTFGFPIDLTLEMAAEQGLTVDEAGFRRLMDEQRQRAKADARAKKTGQVDLSVYRTLAETAGISTFTGYDEVVSEATVRGMVRDGRVVSTASPGDELEVVLDRTPFYAEGGGQLADSGELQLGNGALLVVDDVQRPVDDLIVHRARVIDGAPETGIGVLATVDVERRRSISRAHTATHMVHKAMRELLGETATQAGSENAPGRFRFDFPNAGAVPVAVLTDVEQKVNEMLVADLDVHATYMSLDDARASGATALFGEKYGDIVRVVSVGDWTRELCGGTHAGRTGQLGVVKLLGESSIGAGVRRIEALVGLDAYHYLAREHTLVNLLSELVKVRPEELPDRIAALLERLHAAEKEIDRHRKDALRSSVGDIVGSGDQVGDARLWAFIAPEGTNAATLREVVFAARGRAAKDVPAAVVGASSDAGKANIVVAVSDRGRERGLSANAILQAALPAVDGRGGGKDDVAQGGGPGVDGIEAAMAAARAVVVSRVGAGT